MKIKRLLAMVLAVCMGLALTVSVAGTTLHDSAFGTYNGAAIDSYLDVYVSTSSATGYIDGYIWSGTLPKIETRWDAADYLTGAALGGDSKTAWNSNKAFDSTMSFGFNSSNGFRVWGAAHFYTSVNGTPYTLRTSVIYT